MIIACEKCKSKFRIDEALLKEEGSKVRCSQCRHIFTAYPSNTAPVEEPEGFKDVDETLQETVALDSPPEFDFEKIPEEADAGEPDFGEIFDEGGQEEGVQTLSPDEIPDELEGDVDETIGEEGAAEAGTSEEEPVETEGEAEAVKPPATRKKPRRSRPLLTVLLILLILILAGAAVFFLRPDLIPDSLNFIKPVTETEISDPGVSRLSFKAVSGSFLESEREGQLYVIKGMITNNYPRSRSYILVKGALMDDTGKIVKRKISYAGNSFSDDELKTMDMGAIDEGLRTKAGKGEMNINILPGGSIPIMIVFNNLPENLTEFTIEAVSSAPGQ